MLEGKANVTSVQVSVYTHEKLRGLEEYPKESFNNIILRLIISFEKKEE